MFATDHNGGRDITSPPQSWETLPNFMVGTLKGRLQIKLRADICCVRPKSGKI